MTAVPGKLAAVRLCSHQDSYILNYELGSEDALHSSALNVSELKLATTMNK